MQTNRADQFRNNAEAAERQAALATNPHDRESFLKIAQGWRELLAAEQGSKKRGV